MEIKGKKSYSEAYEELLRCREYIESMTSKLESRNKELQDKKKELDDLYTKMYREEMDVTQLEKLSFSRIIAKIAGNYEDKYQKEYQEYINAKLKYDELNEFIIELQQDISRRKNEIKKEELNAKTIEESLVNDYIEGRERKEEIDQKKQLIYRQQTEIREAITAVMRVRDLTNKAIESYSSAKGWAT